MISQAARHASVLLLSLALPHTLAAEEWKLLRDRQGIQIYSRKVTGSKYEAFKGIIVLKSSPASILGLLDHTEASSEWVQFCTFGKTLKSNGFSERYIYQVMDLPFPLATRDAVFRATTSYNPVTQAITVALAAVADFYPATEYVRIRIGSGYFKVRVIDDDNTEVTWQLHVDPGGAIPALLANMMLVEIPFQSLQRMAQLVIKEPYQRLEFKYDADGNPVDLLYRSWPQAEALDVR